MTWRDKQLGFNFDSVIEVSIDLVDIVDNDEIQEILVATELSMEEKIQWLAKSADQIIKSMVNGKLYELKEWANHNNIKIKTRPVDEIGPHINWEEIILDLGV